MVDFWRVILAFCFLNSVFSTRYLPMVVWDHLNPQLSCKCNWFIIPRIDSYDFLNFVCPTLKITVRQVDDYSRPEGEMNENIFRRKWPGSIDEFKRSVQNNSIHLFCNPRSTESMKMHSCRNGRYGSAGVTFQQHRKLAKNYDTNTIYVFYNNGNDGKESTLESTKVMCTMLFAVYIRKSDREVHDMTFGKTALKKTCQCEPPNTPNPPPDIQTSSITPSLPSLQTHATNSNQEQHTKIQTKSLGPLSKYSSTIQRSEISTSSFTRQQSRITVSVEPPVDTGIKTRGNFNKDHFGYGIILGIIVGVMVCCICFYIVLKKGGFITANKTYKHYSDDLPSRPSRESMFTEYATTL